MRLIEQNHEALPLPAVQARHSLSLLYHLSSSALPCQIPDHIHQMCIRDRLKTGSTQCSSRLFLRKPFHVGNHLILSVVGPDIEPHKGNPYHPASGKQYQQKVKQYRMFLYKIPIILFWWLFHYIKSFLVNRKYRAMQYYTNQAQN